MEQTPLTASSGTQPGDVKETAVRAQANESSSGTALSLQAGGRLNPNGDSPPSPPYVYALGRVGTRFSRSSVEKEFAQVTGRAETAG